MWEEPISSDITVYDPAEEDLPPPEWRVMMKAAADVEGPGSEEEIDERVPMSYQLSESNIEGMTWNRTYNTVISPNSV